MSNFFNFLKSFWKKPKIIFVLGESRKKTAETIQNVLGKHFKIGKPPHQFFGGGGKEILIFEIDLKSPQELKKIKKLIKKSDLPIIIATNTGDISQENIFFVGDKNEVEMIKEQVKLLSPEGIFIENSDDESLRELIKECPVKYLTFGFSESADFMASDVKTEEGVNFKINYRGNIVPVWLEKNGGKEIIYIALVAAAIGTNLDMNLVEISQALKEPPSVDPVVKF